VAASNSTLAVAATANRELTVTRLFDAPRALVFKAWTAPEHAAMWWALEGFTIVTCEMDVRPGGKWRRCMRSPDGVDYWKHGVYREVVPPERLVFTYVNDDADGRPGPNTVVTVTFAEHGTKTRLTLHQVGFDQIADRDGHTGGWTSCLTRFAAWLARS